MLAHLHQENRSVIISCNYQMKLCSVLAVNTNIRLSGAVTKQHVLLVAMSQLTWVY